MKPRCMLFPLLAAVASCAQRIPTGVLVSGLPSKSKTEIEGRAVYLGVEYRAPQTGANDFQPISAAFGAVASHYAVGATREGNLEKAYVFVAAKPIDLWRVMPSLDNWNGRWWAPSPPNGSLEKYREDYVLCPGRLAYLVHCRIKPGTVFAAGPGNSWACKNGDIIPASNHWQVYLPLVSPEQTQVQVLGTHVSLDDRLECTEAWQIEGDTFDRLRSVPVPTHHEG